MADIEQVQSNDTFKQGRTKWNANDQELETRIDANTASINNLTASQNAIFYKKLAYGDGAVSGDNYTFNLASTLGSAFLAEGSVQFSVNGIYYSSNDIQIDTGSGEDFYIEQQSVVWTNNSFTLDSDDEITVYFQKE